MKMLPVRSWTAAMASRSSSITSRAKARPSGLAMFFPMKFTMASFMPMMPTVEKWFFQ